MDYRQQSDTIVLDENYGQEAEAHAPKKHHGQPTPAQVLKWLPRNATPEQQDSAIQANIKPSEITWSDEPDTLHLPGTPAGKSYRDVNLPRYYRESYFTGKPFFNPNLFGGRLGVAGDPVPYSIARDNLITLLLILCFMLASVAFSRSRRFMHKQVKELSREPRNTMGGGMGAITETSEEFRAQFFLVFQTCLLLSLVYFSYVQLYVAQTFTIDQAPVIGIFCAMFAGYFTFKAIAYWAVNAVFFDSKLNEMWMKSYLFLVSMEGAALYPVVILQAYFGLSPVATFASTAAVVILFKMLAFYKAYIIFFKRGSLSLQIFLYFCALEIMPMAAQWGLLAIVSSYLKVNF